MERQPQGPGPRPGKQAYSAPVETSGLPRAASNPDNQALPQGWSAVTPLPPLSHSAQQATSHLSTFSPVPLEGEEWEEYSPPVWLCRRLERGEGSEGEGPGCPHHRLGVKGLVKGGEPL